MINAAVSGDIDTIKHLLQKDPSLVRSAYDYRTAIAFAVRENQPAVVEYLLSMGANPVNSGTDDTLLQIAKDRGYEQVQQLLEKAINTHKVLLGANGIVAAIRQNDLEKVKTLLDESPELIHAKDEYTNQPIHWAVMTRQPAIIDELLNYHLQSRWIYE